MTLDLRSLDAVEPPDQWDDIVARAADATRPGPEAPASEGTGRGRVLATLAAAVHVIAGLAVGVAVAGRGGDDRDHTPATGSADDPDGIWGHEWQLTQFDIGGGSVTQELADIAAAMPVRLDLRTRGEGALSVCSVIEGPVSLDGDLLQMSSMEALAGGCTDPIDVLMATLVESPARVELRGDTVVLRSIPAPTTDASVPVASHPLPEATFVRVDALTAEQQLWGQTWQVVGVRDATGDDAEVDPRTAPKIDATERGRLVLSTCRQPALDATVSDDRIEVDGPWKPTGPLAEHCVDGPSDDVVRAVLRGQDARIEVDGSDLTVTAHEGVVRARLRPTSNASELFGHEWAVVRVVDPASDLRVPDGFHVTADRDARTVAAWGCPGDVGGPARIDGGRLVIDVAPTGGNGSCADAIGSNKGWLALSGWFRDLFAAPMDVEVVGQRASIARDGKQVVLVRLD